MDWLSKNIDSIAVGILLAAVAAYFTYRTIRKNRLTDASDKYRSRILNSLKELYSLQGPLKWPDSPDFNIDRELRNKFPELSAAVSEFASIIADKTELMEDWDTYLGVDRASKNIDQNYFQYMGYKINDEPEAEREEIFHRNVSNLLKHAKT